MKQKSEIIDKLKDVIEAITLGNIASDSIRPADRLLDDCGLDSLDYATVMLQIEEYTGIKIKEDRVQWSEVQTIKQLAELFKEHENL